MEKENKQPADRSHCPPRKQSDKESELRQDLVTGDWVVIATGRAKRLNEFKTANRIQDTSTPADCVFCDPVKSCQEPDVLMYEDGEGNWTTRVFPNKFPAFSPGKSKKLSGEGPYFAVNGIGYHEVIVTRDHFKHIGLMEPYQVAEVIDAFQDRYLSLMNKNYVDYVSIFHNYGREAGASIAHPHSQLMAIPVVSPYVQMELRGAEKHYRENKQCVFCSMIEFESQERKRVIFENDSFVVFCPYASRASFETWILPKKHKPYFERITQSEKMELGEALHEVLGAIYRMLNDPPLNFYIHTSPCDGRDYPHFHWHLEILPKTSIWAGFELQTGIEVSSIPPETAAGHYRDEIGR